MSYANYTEVKNAIENKQKFDGNSCCGYWSGIDGYVIKSYSTEIYSDARGFNERKYSNTTSRLQGIIRRSKLVRDYDKNIKVLAIA